MLISYLVAIACVLAATAIRIALNPLWDVHLPFFTFFPAVIAAAWFGGFAPGIVASLLSAAVVDFLWLHPINQFGVSAPAESLALTLFVVVGAGVSILSELLHRSRQRLAVAQRERLNLAQERLALVDSTGQAIFGVDLDGRCIFANRACAEMLGGSPSGLLGRDMRELAPDHPSERSPSLREQLVSRSDGTSFLAQSWAHPVVVEGRVTGTVVALTDLTERRRTEQERLEIAARQRLAVETGRLGLWEYDVAADRATWSERMDRILGPVERPITRAAFLALVDPRDRHRIDIAIRRALTISDAAEYEIEYRVRSGQDAEPRWLAARATTLRDQTGRPLRMIGTMMDITERKRIEEELRRLLEAEHAAREQAEAAAATLRKLQLITDHALSQLGVRELLTELMRRIREVLACDTATVLLWDEARRGLRPVESDGLREEIFEDLCIPLGAGIAGRIAETKAGLILNDLSDVDIVSPFLRKRVRSLIGVPLRSGQQLVGVIHVGNATPRVFADADLELLRRVADRAVLAIDRAHLAESERHARDEAERANRSKDEFLAVLSHELRTPLTAMLGWVKLLRTGRVGPAQTERALESIERNTRLQARLIEDLLDLSRAVTGKLLLDLRPMALGAVVQDAAESFASAAAEKGVKLAIAIGPVTVRGDALRLGQVVTNLVGNAVKFTPAGGDISVRLEPTGNDARLTVRDTGLGIDPDLLPHIFDRFRQADGGGSRRQAGLGLGLAIVRNLVELHGGTVRAESDGAGQGATFTVTLPVAAETASIETGSETPESAVDRFRLDGARVLLVDDDADSLELLSTVLRQHGADVTAVADVTAALDGLSARKFDVLISDLSMPGRSGFDLIREVRQALPPPASRIPAVAVTALTRPEDRQRALGAGFDAFLTKPVDPSAFVRVAMSVAVRPDAA
ncbi:MAG: hypothetical protein AUH30_13480 [Candidatus Rokubacteria bacterium 13_1_40CM_68_15]|nr:MAG: hypothetical protein AUH30_13480 [Candidatus Rokubacteria bacterium 13_1_40CM_68_15]